MSLSFKVLVFSSLSLFIPLCIGTPIGEGEGVTVEPPNETTSRFEVQFDGESDEDYFKYPTTPFPLPALGEGSTIPPYNPDDENEVGTIKVNGPIILGNKTCKCGTSLKTKIVGGEAVPISELPWTAALIRKRNGTTPRGPYCGGTLISNQYILTASHCVDGFEADKLQVWLNEEDFRVENETTAGTIKIDVQKIIMHPEYDRRRIENDIALLKLATPVDIEKTIRPACLPADNSETYEKEKAIVAGWGATAQGGTVSSTLQKVEVPVLSNTYCNWRTLYLGRINENQLCAGDVSSGGKDSCQGDSGGPLVLNRGDDSQKLLIGVVSYGFGCAQKYAPGVYTRVSQYPKWIVENSGDAEYCSA